MSTNKNLIREIAINLIKSQEFICPNCGMNILRSRYTYKKQNVKYKCLACKEYITIANIFNLLITINK